MPQTLEQQLDQFTPEELEMIKQQVIAMSGNQGTRGGGNSGILRGATKVLRGFGEGALLGFQGRPISEHSAFQARQPDKYEELLRMEQLKNQVDPSRRQAQMELEEIKRKKYEQSGGVSRGTTNVQKLNTGKTFDISQAEDAQIVSEEPPIEYIPKGANKYGIMEYDIDDSKRKAWQKAQEKVMEDAASAEKSVIGTRDLIRSYSESRGELKESGFENVGKADAQGFIERTGAALVEKTGTLPKTTKYLNRKEVIANQAAKDVEGGRVTDQDRAIYANAMANAVKFPDETNIGLASSALLDLKRKGGNIDPVLNEFKNSGVDLFSGIAKEVERLESPIKAQGKEDPEYQKYLQAIGQ